MALKVLVCGDVKGNFRQLFNKVERLNKNKGPFDFVLCVGDFFGTSPSNWEPYKSGALKVPVLTYILGPNEDQHVSYYGDLGGCELCSNLYHLGKRGILTSSGLKIAYVSGRENTDCNSIQILRKDVEAVRDFAYKGKDQSEYLGIDVLLTSDWPKSVSNLVGSADESVQKASNEGSQLLSWLVTQLRPRYHFAGLNNIFFERPPYRNLPRVGSLNVHCTRFIALSTLTGKKWIYGVVLTPIDKISKDELYQRTANETDIPYSVKISSQSEQFFFDMSGKNQGKNPRKRKLNVSQDKCWFCLAGGQDPQTVVHIGTDVYVAVPKGGLHHLHFIICPVKHLESYLHLPRSVRDEVAGIKDAITKYYSRTREVPVFFERYYRTSHMQLNTVPVPASRVENLRQTLIKHAEKNNLEVEEMEDNVKLGDVFRLDDPYLYLEVPGRARFYVRCGQDFPINFARIVLASKALLNAQDKVDWKACTLPEEEEQKLALHLRGDLKELFQ